MNDGPSKASLLAPTHARFGVLGFACTLSLLTYLDRVCIMRVRKDIQASLDLDNVQMSLVFAAFLVGYALFEVPAGWLGDVWGPRRVIIRIVLWWSLFTALTGCVWRDSAGSSGPMFLGVQLSLGFVLIILVRFLFGCGEAGAYPNLARVVGAWFPFRERARAQGAIWMSARLGGAMAPFVIGRLTSWLGWRPAFWVLGVVGLCWCSLFALWFRNTPEEKNTCNAAERELIRAGLYSWKADEARAAHGSPPWGRLLGSLTVWAICLASCCVSFSWYFYPTWQPKYLEDAFGLNAADTEILTGLPFLCGAVGSLAGGGLSDLLMRLTGSPRWGRSLLGLIGFGGAGLCVLGTVFVTEAWQAVTLLCLAFLINDLAIPPIWAVCADIGGRYAGSLSGFMNMAGGVGAVLGVLLAPQLDLALPGHTALARWHILFTILAGAWFVAGLAWLLIDASKRLVRET